MKPLQEKEGPCWSGYEMIGWKEKNGKKVPNCVPIEEGEVKDTNKASKREYERQLGQELRFKVRPPQQGPKEKGRDWVPPDERPEHDIKTGRSIHRGNMGRMGDRLSKRISQRTSIEPAIHADRGEREARLASYGKNQDDRIKKVAWDNLPPHLQKIGAKSMYGSRYTIEEASDEINEYCPRCLMEYIVRKKLGPLEEAEYQGRSVPLGKPMRGDVKKFKVFVKDPSTGNVKKVNFGDPNMTIKKSNPARRRSFRARHRCETPGPRTKARYWSCRKW